MGYVYNDGKKVDDKLEALRQAEIALKTARDLLKECRSNIATHFASDPEAGDLYAKLTDFLGD